MARSGSKVRVSELADRQDGRIKWVQLKELGLSDATLVDWTRDGYLHRRLPGVYAVGHVASSYRALLTEALLYAGPGAALSGPTAAHWRGLLDDRPRQIHVSSPRQCDSQPGIVVHGRRTFERDWHNGLPTTTLPHLFLDLAATEPLHVVRYALANADFRRILDIQAMTRVLGRGRAGSATLRKALDRHQPKLAYTRSRLERAWIELCERAGFPTPEMNTRVAGWPVDAVWYDARLVVELDGYDNHHSRAQVKRDRRKDLDLRGVGFGVLHYSAEQVFEQPAAVIIDARRAREERRRAA